MVYLLMSVLAAAVLLLSLSVFQMRQRVARSLAALEAAFKIDQQYFVEMRGELVKVAEQVKLALDEDERFFRLSGDMSQVTSNAQSAARKSVEKFLETELLVPTGRAYVVLKAKLEQELSGQIRALVVEINKASKAVKKKPKTKSTK